jgi:hypothetical protein
LAEIFVEALKTNIFSGHAGLITVLKKLRCWASSSED